MFFVYMITALGIFAQYKLGRDDDETDYKRSLPELEARLDRESQRLDREIEKLLREHKRLCGKR